MAGWQQACRPSHERDADPSSCGQRLWSASATMIWALISGAGARRWQLSRADLVRFITQLRSRTPIDPSAAMVLATSTTSGKRKRSPASSSDDPRASGSRHLSRPDPACPLPPSGATWHADPGGRLENHKTIATEPPKVNMSVKIRHRRWSAEGSNQSASVGTSRIEKPASS